MTDKISEIYAWTMTDKDGIGRIISYGAEGSEYPLIDTSYERIKELKGAMERIAKKEGITIELIRTLIVEVIETIRPTKKNSEVIDE